MKTAAFYVRILFDKIPENHKVRNVFREDRNYPVLAVDSEKNRILVPNDKNQLTWAPLSAFVFVKLG